MLGDPPSNNRSVPRAMPGVARVTAAAFILISILIPQYLPSSRSVDIDRLHVQNLLNEGRYESAVRQAGQLLVNAQSSSGPESLAALAATDLLVEARALNGEGAHDTTLTMAQNVVALKRRLFGEEHQEVATSLRNLGTVLIAAGEYERAREEFERAVHVIERSDPTNALGLADALNGLGDAEIRTEHYDAAEKTLARALGLGEQVGPSHRLVAQALERRGFLLLQKGAYREARPQLERALQIFESRAPMHADTAALLDTLGTLSWFEGDVGSSERFYRRALQLARETLVASHPSIAIYQRDLAWALRHLGRISEARDLQREALAIGRRALGGTHPEVVWELSDLAGSQMQFGEYPDARRLYEEALAAVTTRYGPTHLNAATILHNLALYHARLGDWVEANRRLEQAIEIWQRVLGPSHPYVGRALDSLAEVFGDEGRYAEARSFFERALRIRETSLGLNHREVAESLTSLASLFLQSGAGSEARKPLERAMRIWEASGSTSEPGYAAALALTGEVQVLHGEFERARQSLERAMVQQVSLLGPAHPVVAATKVGLASAVMGLGRHADALRLALEAEEASRNHLRLTARYLSEHESLSYAASRRRGLDLALSAPAPPPGAASMALLEAIVRSRALVLDEMSERHAAIRKTGNGELDALLSAVGAARERLANLLVRGTSLSQPLGYRDMLADAQREVELLERKLGEQSVEFRTEIARQRASLEQVRRSLPAGAALVSFVRYDHATPWQPRSAVGPAYVVFVLRGGTAPPSLVRLGPAREVDGLVQRWRAEAARGALRTDRQPRRSELAYRAAAAALRQRIWDPIVPLIGSTTRVFVVPDGALNLVSFASLPAGSDRYIVEQGPIIHYLATERDLVSASTESTEPGVLLALGGPDFGRSSLPPVLRDSRRGLPAPARDGVPIRTSSTLEVRGS